MVASERMSRCPDLIRPEFRQRAVELAQADDEGRRDALSSRDRDELVESRRQARTLKLENEILKRAAACFARENVRPK